MQSIYHSISVRNNPRRGSHYTVLTHTEAKTIQHSAEWIIPLIPSIVFYQWQKYKQGCYDPTLAWAQLGRNLKQMVTKLISKIKIPKKHYQKEKEKETNLQTKHTNKTL